DLSVIIGSDLARTLWGAADPVGRRLQSWGDQGEVFGGDPDVTSEMRASPPPDNAKPNILTVVGVVDAAQTGKGNDLRQIRLFVPSAATGIILVRTQGGGTVAIPMIRDMMTREFPALPVYDMETLSQRDANARRELMRESEFASGAGLLILLLAS